MRDIPLIEASGSSFECGHTIGRALRDQIHANIEFYLALFAARGNTPEEVRGFACGLVPEIKGYAPELLEEVRGLAAGAEVAFEDVIVLNARTEIMSGLQLAAESECTSLAALPEATADGHTLIGENWDWRAAVAERTALLSIAIPERPRALVFTEAGFVGKIGLNEYGIGVCANLLTSAHDRGRPGVPYHVILRKILAAPDLHRAMQAVILARRGSSGNFLIGARGGEAIDIEATPDDFACLLPHEGILAHANHFAAPDLRAVDTHKAVSTLTFIRQERARRLLARDAGRVGTHSFMRVFRDHFSFPHVICRHVDETVPEAERTLSAASIVMDLDLAEMHLASGPPCEHEYQRITVAEGRRG